MLTTTTLLSRRHEASAADGSDEESLNSLLAQLKNVNTKGKKRAKRPTASASPTPLSTSAQQLKGEAEAPRTSTPATSAAPAAVDPPPVPVPVPQRIQKLLETEAKRCSVGSEPHTHTPAATAGATGRVPMSQEREAVFSASDKSACVPGGVARPSLTTSEMIQDGAPQHLATLPDDATNATVRPVLPVSGLTALADVFGKLVAPPTLMEDSAGNGVYAELKLSYTVPSFLGMSQTFNGSLEIEGRAYGQELSNFSVQYLKVGDVVHVSGVLLPAAVSSGSTTFVVAALPVGGNVSVVLRSPSK